MCEIAGISITGVHHVFEQLKVLICLKRYHYKTIVGITHGIVQEMNQKSVTSAYEENHGIVIGDGAFDSRRQGEFCTYTLISKASQKVLSTVTVPRSWTGSSAKLEEIGLFQALMDLPAAVLDKIKTVCTDEAPSIVKKMREINDQRIQDGKATIKHAHCVWHRDKNISSKLSSFFSTAGGSAIKIWTSLICRHWYYSCENASN